MTVEVTDVNDNIPKFESPIFTANINESAPPGTYITKITATDRDSGEFGADSIIYELIGDGTDKLVGCKSSNKTYSTCIICNSIKFAFRFDVDKKAGIITIASCSIPGGASCLDYETKPAYFLTYKVSTYRFDKSFLVKF